MRRLAVRGAAFVALLAMLAVTVGARGVSSSATLFVATTGSDASTCTQASPCQSFDRAYRVAQPGQTVEVAGGTYPAQTIFGDPAKTSSTDVVFRPAAGASVVVAGSLVVWAKHLELDDMSFSGGWFAKPDAGDITFRDVSAPVFAIQSARYINVLGGEVGPWLATGEGDPKIAKSSPTSPYPVTNILIDGVHFHDILRPAGSGYHTECLQIGSATALTVRNSRFDNCATQSIFLASWGPGYALQNITIENNTFGTVTDGFHSVTLDVSGSEEPCVGCTIVGNSSVNPIATNASRPGSSISVSGNSMSQADLAAPGWCDSGVNGIAWTGNHFLRAPTCGSSAVIGR